MDLNESANVNAVAPLQCGTCKHWHQLPTDPNNVADIKGQCRESPPTCTTMPTRNGLATVANYSVLPPNFEACSRHQHRLKLAA